MKVKPNRQLLKICSMLLLLIAFLCGCGGSNATAIENEKKYEVDGVVFENDLVRITGVSTDEYVDVFQTENISFTYFSKDFAGLDCASILNIGGSVLRVAPGETYLDELPCSTLSVFEDGTEQVITDMLEEFYICKDSQGNIKVYYEIYHLYAQEEKGNTTKMYLTLKAYKVEFEYYTNDFEAKVEMI